MVARITHPITIGDKTYLVSPLDDYSHMSLDEWVRSKYVAANTGFIEKLKSDSDKRLALEVAYKNAAMVTWMSDYGARLMGTIEGVAQLLWEGVRHNHPDVTADDLKKDLLDPANLARANAAFRHLQNLGSKPDKKGVKAKRKSPSRKKKSTSSS